MIAKIKLWLRKTHYLAKALWKVAMLLPTIVKFSKSIAYGNPEQVEVAKTMFINAVKQNVMDTTLFETRINDLFEDDTFIKHIYQDEGQYLLVKKIKRTWITHDPDGYWSNLGYYILLEPR